MAEISRVGLIANLDKPGARSLLETLLNAFEEAGVATAIEIGSAKLIENSQGKWRIEPLADLAENSELLVVLGGDGTLLNVVGQLGRAVKPIAAINVGTLGFLTCATADEYQALVTAIANGNFQVSPRAIIEARLISADGEVEEIVHALNEVTIVRGTTSCVVHVETRVGDAFVNHYTGDGIIVATPTGSTAYSLSAGGPILEPGCGVFVMTPICPHALANRAIVFNDGREIELHVPKQRDQLLFTADGRLITELDDAASVKIRKARFELPLVTLPEGSFYRVLRRKLGWFGSSVVSNDESAGEQPISMA